MLWRWLVALVATVAAGLVLMAATIGSGASYRQSGEGVLAHGEAPIEWLNRNNTHVVADLPERGLRVEYFVRCADDGAPQRRRMPLVPCAGAPSGSCHEITLAPQPVRLRELRRYRVSALASLNGGAIGPQQLAAALADAADEWNAALAQFTPSAVRVCGLERADLPFTVDFSLGAVNFIDEVDTAVFSDQMVLAVTRVAYTVATGEIVDWDQLYNEALPWSLNGASGAVDLPSVVTHELGHSIGMGHADSTQPACAGATMWPTLTLGETNKRTLEQCSDIYGLQLLYADGDTTALGTCPAATTTTSSSDGQVSDGTLLKAPVWLLALLLFCLHL